MRIPLSRKSLSEFCGERKFFALALLVMVGEPARAAPHAISSSASLPAAVHGGLGFITCLKIFFSVAPELINLFLVVLALYLMLDGIRRWGKEMDGAFSRSLIGLFILQTSSADVEMVPHVAALIAVTLWFSSVSSRRAEQSPDLEE